MKRVKKAKRDLKSGRVLLMYWVRPSRNVFCGGRKWVFKLQGPGGAIGLVGINPIKRWPDSGEGRGGEERQRNHRIRTLCRPEGADGRSISFLGS